MINSKMNHYIQNIELKSFSVSISGCVMVKKQRKIIQDKLVVISSTSFTFIDGFKKNFGNLFYPHNPEQFFYIFQRTVIQDKLHQHIFAYFFLFIFGNVSEKIAVFSDKCFNFRAVHNLLFVHKYS